MKLIKEFPKEFPVDQIIIGYDSARQLQRFCKNQAKKYPNSTMANLIAKIRKVHDRLHLKNHHENCRRGELDPDMHEEMKGVNTQVDEQFFSHLLQFVFTFRNTSATRAPLWILLIQHQWNLKKESKLNNSIPSKEQLKLVPSLKSHKVFYCAKRPISEKSCTLIKTMYSKLKNRLLKPWSVSSISQKSFTKRKSLTDALIND